MKQIRLGNSSLKVSRLCVGCWSFGGEAGDYWGAQSQKEVDTLVGEALDRGINFFDTAFMYNNGASEVSLGKALKARRKEAVICNKIVVQDREQLEDYETTLGNSLKRLETDHIDLMMIHWPVSDADLLKANLEALLDARRKGIIREIGVSNFSLETLALAKEAGVETVANEFAWNLMARGIEREALPYCNENRIGVMAYMPLMQGILSGKYGSIAEIPGVRRRTVHFSSFGNPECRHGMAGAEADVEKFLKGLSELSRKTGISCGTLSIAWLIAKGAAAVIAGCRTVAQLRENAAAAETVLPGETLSALDDLSRPLLEKLGACLDLWQSPDKSRIW
ncbi:MAG: aldo/keto reductase [Candidatus Accumulibacter sp.]|jgi:aryl-alcohol dehydrogenase-like predicted oxidoreductase|nr:aldo/keto reductase [Accumulibacter sp.]